MRRNERKGRVGGEEGRDTGGGLEEKIKDNREGGGEEGGGRGSGIAVWMKREAEK